MKDSQDSNSEAWEIDALKDSLGVNFVGIGSCMENMMRREQFKTDEKVLADSVDLIFITWRCLWVLVS